MWISFNDRRMNPHHYTSSQLAVVTSDMEIYRWALCGMCTPFLIRHRVKHENSKLVENFIQRQNRRTWMPTSLVLTSRQEVPSCFILASACSLRFPCSTPLETSGIGISLCTRYTRVLNPFFSVNCYSQFSTQNTKKRLGIKLLGLKL